MANLPSGRPVAVAILVLLSLLAWTNADAPYLDLKPKGDDYSRPVGVSWILTCTPMNIDPSQVTSLEWRDPKNNVVDSQRSNEHGTAEISTTRQSNSGLSLVFNPFKEHHAGNYTCIANYATETLSKTVKIGTTYGITFVDAPEQQYAILGQEYKIKCQVSAQPAPSVKWTRNGEEIVTNDHYIIELHALKVKKVDLSDQGTYSCVASVLDTGEFKERLIQVEVYEVPRIEELPSPIKIVEGRTENISCKGSGIPPPKYSWISSINSQNLSKTERFSVDADTGVLTIRNVHRQDSGEYQCIAKNAAGKSNSNTQLYVITKPKIMEYENQTTAVGQSTKIMCKAYGIPTPEIVFRKQTSMTPFVAGIQPHDDRITVTSERNAEKETIGILSIRNVLREDDGVYECTAKNEVEHAYKNGHLTVQFPPSFAKMPNETVWSWAQKIVNLTCIAESIPNATIRWTKGGHTINSTDGTYRIHGNTAISVLTVTPRDTRYYGPYVCTATNPHGEASNTIYLKEAQKPQILQQVRMSKITATTIEFELVLPSFQKDLPIRTITVQYKERDQPWTHALNKTWSLNSPYVLEDLKPLTMYSFRFRATNDVGPGSWGTPLEEQTPTRSKPEPPQIQNHTSNSDYDKSLFSYQYEVTWVAPADNGEPIDRYEIRYCEVIRVPPSWEVQEHTCRTEIMKGKRSKHMLNDLTADKYYRVEVRAHNAIDLGDPGTIYFRTAKANNKAVHYQAPLLSSAAIIGIVIASLFLVIVIVDVICCCVYSTGVIYYICERSRRKPVDEDDVKLGSLYGWRFPLPYCDQKMANVAGVTAIQDSGNGKNTIKLVKHTAIDEKEPLKEEKKITPIIDSGLRRETSITFDGKRSISKTGFVGKDSAV